MSVVAPLSATPAAPAARIDVRSFLLGGGTMLVIAWLGLLRPAQQHLAALERQVGHVARSVADLNGTADGAKGTNALLTHLQIQARQLGEAEEAFARHERLVARVSAQAAALEQAGAMLARIDTLHAALADRGQSVGEAATMVDELADLSTKVRASRDEARLARESLAVLDALHQDLSAGMGRIEEATPVLDHVQALVGRIADTAPQVTRAAEVQRRAEDFHHAVIAADATVASAEGTGARLVRVAADLAAGTAAMTPAEDRLARLLAIQERLTGGATALDDAAAALTRLHDLRDGLRDAAGTVSGIQHMIVDVMLLQPAVDRAMAALKPVIEMTRTARQADPAAMSPRPVAERGETTPAPQAAPADRPAPPSPVAGTAPAVVGAADAGETVK